MAKFFDYTVTQSARTYVFPLDMLRYDSAWPRDEQAVENIANSIKSFSNKKMQINLRSMQEPTEARWASFGWIVERVR